MRNESGPRHTKHRGPGRRTATGKPEPGRMQSAKLHDGESLPATGLLTETLRQDTMEKNPSEKNPSPEHGNQRKKMELYQLEYILHEPEKSHGGMYRAEIPALQGCRAWGDTPEETLEALWGNARIFLQLRKESGEPLPPAMTRSKMIQGIFTVTA